jgi:dTDP-4-amino-4,6-dideoxygalactose transaminase
MNNNRINVTEAFVPDSKLYMSYLQKAFDSKWLTNRGPLCMELEDKLKSFLNVSHIILMNNGTLPIQIALKILGGQGEIITTPFSYVATTASIVWENCTPVFVDIDPDYLTIDETKIEAAITTKTTCILATHVFGNPCNVEEIERIAKKHNLYVIYDAAHCFGVEYKGKSIFESGDISTVSFHATKIFHTGEGGALFSNNTIIQEEAYYKHNFGHKTPDTFNGPGINAKISELQSAMGLAVLPFMNGILKERREIIEYYQSNLKLDLFKSIRLRDQTVWNYSYFPLIFESEGDRELVQKALNEKEIFPRRYFYPSLNTLEYVTSREMKVSESIASRILCLPLYVGLKEDELKLIVQTILSVFEKV